MSHETSGQPSLPDLFAGFLQKQADAQAVGISAFDGEVMPYESGPVQPLDPKLAWDESLAVLAVGGKAIARPGLEARARTLVAIAIGGWDHAIARRHPVLRRQLSAADA